MHASAKRKLLRILSRLYHEPKSELIFADEYQLIVCVMLSAQSTDKKVNERTPELFGRYADFHALSRARLSTVEQIIREINYYKTKARHLIAMAKKVMSEFDGQLPRTHGELLSLPGVGNKTANVLLGELGVEATFPVDTHVFRVAKRLGLARGKTRELVEEELKQEFVSKHWRNLHHWLIFHGRRVCQARRPRCGECGLAALCPSRKEFEEL